MNALRWLIALALAGCGREDENEDCVDFPADARSPGGVLDGADDCGHWLLVSGEHVYVNVVVEGPEAGCEVTAEGQVSVPYEPIFSDLSDEDPKWTIDVLALDPGEGSLDVSCDDGASFEARFTVVAE